MILIKIIRGFISAQREFTQLLAVSLAYRKVEWEHIKSGTSGADDWRAPLEA
ncbi:TPA: Hcp1 family type VI secretion system effector [Escherichia coli]|nr:Hcp1 family type VI secretion system effector [Escherichia coli]